MPDCLQHMSLDCWIKLLYMKKGIERTCTCSRGGKWTLIPGDVGKYANHQVTVHTQIQSQTVKIKVRTKSGHVKCIPKEQVRGGGGRKNCLRRWGGNPERNQSRKSIPIQVIREWLIVGPVMKKLLLNTHPTLRNQVVWNLLLLGYSQSNTALWQTNTKLAYDTFWYQGLNIINKIKLL